VVLLAAFGTACVLIGFFLLTEKAERWHKRGKPQLPARRYYPEGCQSCGMDDTPLNRNRHCYYCADLHQIKTGGRPIPTLPDPGRAWSLKP
jgi:hypothetical protein